jgi:hypothetical protein
VRVAARCALGKQLAPDYFQIADNDLQQIVEIMRQTAGELTDGFHFLALAQRIVRLLAFGHRGRHAARQTVVQIGELNGLFVQLGIERDDATIGVFQFRVQPFGFLLLGLQIGQALQQLPILRAHFRHRVRGTNGGQCPADFGQPRAGDCRCSARQRLVEGHDCPRAGAGCDVEPFHQASRARDTDAFTVYGLETSFQHSRHIGNAGAFIADDHAQMRLGGAMHGKLHPAAATIRYRVTRDFRNCRGDPRLILGIEAK